MKKLSCIQIELTNNCNYRCVNCPRHGNQMTRKKGFADFDLVKRLLDESFEISKYVNFSFFGEPLLHPKFLDILAYTQRKPKGFKVVINSNMSLVTKHIMEKFIEFDLTQLRISIDAASNETYNIVRGGNSCLDLNGNIIRENRLNAIDEKLRYWFSLKNHTSTRHVFPVSSLNKNDVIPYVKKWYPYLGSNDHILLKSILTYGGKISDNEITNSFCNIWSLDLLTVDWDGNVSPCNLDTNMDLIVGNVKDSTLKQLYQNDKFNKLKQLSKQKKVFPCNNCADSNNYTKNITINKNVSLGDVLFKKIGKIYNL